MKGVGKLPGGASRQNSSRSGRRKACTPVKLRCVSFGQLLSNIIMLCWILDSQSKMLGYQNELT